MTTIIHPRVLKWVQDWESLSDDEKRLYARFMEVFAGFLGHTDYHIGRLIDFLKDIGRYENTLVVLLSDNGASSEGARTARSPAPSGYGITWLTTARAAVMTDRLPRRRTTAHLSGLPEHPSASLLPRQGRGIIIRSFSSRSQRLTSK
jgi:arylsulfatase A-like enzyme